MIIYIFTLIYTLNFKDTYLYPSGMGRDFYVDTRGYLTQSGQDWDINDDGKIDIVAACEFEWTSGWHQEPHTYSYILYNRDSLFNSYLRDSLPTNACEAAAIIDVNRDGYEDIIFGNGGKQYSTGYAYIYYGSANGFNRYNKDSFLVYNNHGSVETGDINNDGLIDIFWANFEKDFSFIYFNTGLPPFFSISNTDTIYIKHAHGSEIYDIDMDNNLDLLVLSYYAVPDSFGSYSYIFYDIEDGYEDVDSFFFYGPGDDPAVGDIDGNGYPDLVISSHSRGVPYSATEDFPYIYILYNEGGRVFTRDSVYAPGTWSVSLKDLDRDGFLDIIANTEVKNEPGYIYYMKGREVKKVSKYYVSTGSMVKAVDIDFDGFPDIVSGEQGSERIKILKNNEGEFSYYANVAIDVNAIDASLTRDLIDTFFCYFKSYFSGIVNSIDFSIDTIWHGDKSILERRDVLITIEKLTLNGWEVFNPQKGAFIRKNDQYRLKIALSHILRVAISPLHFKYLAVFNEDLPDEELFLYDVAGRRIRTDNINASGIYFIKGKGFVKKFFYLKAP